MIEWILILGLLFVLGIVILLHVIYAVGNSELRKALELEDLTVDNSTHFWFAIIETILFLSTSYIFSRWLLG